MPGIVRQGIAEEAGRRAAFDAPIGSEKAPCKPWGGDAAAAGAFR